MRLIDANAIPYVNSENGCLEDYAYRYDINQIPTVEAVVFPCKVGDEVWCVRDTRVYNKPVKGVVSEIYFRDNMDMCIIVRRLCRGRWGEKIFATEQEAQAAIDSSRMVELPCKPGDIVFYMNRYRRNVWPMKIISVEINSQGINEYGCWCDVPESYTPICFKPIAIGKTVFFTQEEAEAELARRTANE